MNPRDRCSCSTRQSAAHRRCEQNPESSGSEGGPWGLEKLWQSINGIYDINMQAVVRKSQLVKQDSAGFFTSMAVAATLCVLLALGYFWYFPLYISTSFGYLAERIRNLLKNIGVALDTNTGDEAFVILQAINLLENKLGVKNEDRDSL